MGPSISSASGEARRASCAHSDVAARSVGELRGEELRTVELRVNCAAARLHPRRQQRAAREAEIRQHAEREPGSREVGLRAAGEGGGGSGPFGVGYAAIPPKKLGTPSAACALRHASEFRSAVFERGRPPPVSYTHLTLPTICSV